MLDKHLHYTILILLLSIKRTSKIFDCKSVQNLHVLRLKKNNGIE